MSELVGPNGDVSFRASGHGFDAGEESALNILRNALLSSAQSSVDREVAERSISALDHYQQNDLDYVKTVLRRKSLQVKFDTQEDLEKLEEVGGKLWPKFLPIHKRNYLDGSIEHVIGHPLIHWYSAWYSEEHADQSYTERLLRTIGSLPEGISIDQLAGQLPQVDESAERERQYDPIVPRSPHYFRGGGYRNYFAETPHLSQLPTNMSGVDVAVAHKTYEPYPFVLVSFNLPAFQRKVGYSSQA